MPQAIFDKIQMPQPSYFLVRTTGEVVPLIAVDELPPGIEVVGIPRSIDLEDTAGMLNLGLQKGSGAFYAVAELGGRGKSVAQREGKIAAVHNQTIDQFPISHKLLASKTKSPPNATPATAPNNRGRASLAANLSPPASPSSLKSSPPLTPCDTASLSVRTYNSSSQSHPYKHTSNKAPGQTQLCRHWCRYGICKWAQQCRYRHIMPMAPSGLEEAGLADWPAWYRKLNPGYFISEIMGTAGAHRGRGHRSGRGGAARLGDGHGGVAIGTCCNGHVSSGHPPANRSAGIGVGNEETRAKSKRLLTGNTVANKERFTGRAKRGDEVGEQIIARLRYMERGASGRARPVNEEGQVSDSMIIERAQTRATRRWEDESENEAADGGDECESDEAAALTPT